MARTPAVTRDKVPEKYRAAFDSEVAISRSAMENGPGSVMINSPEMRKRANQLVFYFREESELPQRIQELAMILTARDKDCQYIWYAHAARAREEGISCGVSSGGAVAGALRLSEELENAVIVAIICDRGDRYLSTGVFPGA